MLRLVVLTLFGLVSLSVPSAAVSAEMLVAIATSPSGTVLQMDRDSLRTSPHNNEFRRFSVVHIWGVYTIPASRRTSSRVERSLFSFDCKSGTSMVLAYRNFRYGTIKLQDWQAADLGWNYKPVDPDSLTAQAMAYACSGGKIPVRPKTAEDGQTLDGDDIVSNDPNQPEK
jgi:hypothetical protein